MRASISAKQFREMIEYVAQQIERSETRLNDLDAAAGDGDHGITMRVGFRAIGNQIANLPPESSVGDILQCAGHAFMDATGGAIGVILGRMLIAAGAQLKTSTALTAFELAMALSAMQSAATKAGKAVPGDKTIVDSIHAASQALNASRENADLATALTLAATAAEQGAAATSSMHCRHGRASRLSDRAMGHPDPGAVSFSIIVRSMADWIDQSSDNVAARFKAERGLNVSS